jgi:hypothetical protein
MARISISSAKFDVTKFNGFGNFGLQQRRVKDLLVQQEMVICDETRRDGRHRMEGP